MYVARFNPNSSIKSCKFMPRSLWLNGEDERKQYGFNWIELSPLIIIILMINDVFEIAEREDISVEKHNKIFNLLIFSNRRRDTHKKLQNTKRNW